jgi:lipoprotein-anchoring transpeptidase ErfK/SrfK
MHKPRLVLALRGAGPLRAIALVAVVAATVAACSSTSNGTPHAAGTASGSTPAGASSSSSSAAPKPTHSVIATHVGLNIGDGGQVGIGMPIIADFNHVITDGKAFEKATTVTVNGKKVDGGWYFEDSDPASGHLMEAHYRTQNYWPAHAQIQLALPVKGLSGGLTAGHQGEYVFTDNLTLSFTTGPANILTVDDSTHTMSVVSDGKPYGTFPVSLGASSTPTRRGTKVIMEKLPTVCMHDTDNTYYECGIQWDMRLTYDGEYLHSAPWNVGNLGKVDTSNGCTNLSPTVAKQLYDFLEIGDVVRYPNANGAAMHIGDGYGDWNVPWQLWLTGGAVSTQS